MLLLDTTTPEALPRSVAAAAGYVDGAWPSYEPIRRRHPRAIVLSITVAGAGHAMIGDVERGDLDLDGLVAFLERRHEGGCRRPAWYASLAYAVELVPQLEARGWPRDRYRLWLAHWTGRAHRCDVSCGWLYSMPGATQFAPAPRGGPNYDTSLTTPGWARAVRSGH